MRPVAPLMSELMSEAYAQETEAQEVCEDECCPPNTAQQVFIGVGTLVVAESFRTAGQPAMIDPDPPVTSGLAHSPLVSVPGPQTSYPVGAMIDMEGWAFATATSGSGETNRRQGLKIISDNSSTPPTLDKSTISALIEAKMNDIDEFASTLIAQAHWKHE